MSLHLNDAIVDLLFSLNVVIRYDCYIPAPYNFASFRSSPPFLPFNQDFPFAADNQGYLEAVLSSTAALGAFFLTELMPLIAFSLVV